MYQPTVFKNPEDPYVYLTALGQWYCYDPNSKPLGNGAMGTVYLGYKCNDRTPVAIKRVKDSYANIPQVRARARQEAALAFRHENLVEMIGYCDCSPNSGPIFMISKYVVGKDSDDFIAHDIPGERRVEVACSIVKQVLSALDYVHSRGVVHRDIKPSNIMVEESGNVRLMDLGIARVDGGNQFSMAGFIGTPQYAAPEQCLRDKDTNVSFTPATDIYSLGVTMYELITGENPFDKPIQSETLTAQIKEKLPVVKGIPHSLMNVLLKATEKDPEKRYQTAMEMSEAITAATNEPLRLSLWERIKRWLS